MEEPATDCCAGCSAFQSVCQISLVSVMYRCTDRNMNLFRWSSSYTLAHQRSMLMVPSAGCHPQHQAGSGRRCEEGGEGEELGEGPGNSSGFAFMVLQKRTNRKQTLWSLHLEIERMTALPLVRHMRGWRAQIAARNLVRARADH